MLEAVLLIWGVRDEVLEKLPIKGHWLYGEYDFIAFLRFEDNKELEEFKRELHHLIGSEKFKIYPVKYSARKEPFQP
ncbi:hypothetical protein OCC_07606 [Thermococcus litoralis DSM 5473]|uniref:Lrp/AsnC family transcriptional regulator n=1 Tax=Thermococcus litoralis (strain ATCC 51850 / DSM 5473 / JCM 8560 / NS-C) TaxID=523849 RepID=H3ZL08_THELN|nr:hypothetical protein [Thermococcus litoralis]EHR79347.1 hypothetical protein OCC_07606 [Thermococcus litoralis DSM 5473]